MQQQVEDFRRNVKIHMDHQELSAPALALRAGISAKTLNNVLNGRHASQLNVLTKIAKGLRIQLWLLWLPELPADVPHDETFPRLIETAAKLSPQSRKHVARVAEYELQAKSKD